MFFAKAIAARSLVYVTTGAELQLMDLESAVVLGQLCHELFVEPLLFVLTVADCDVVELACECTVVVGPETRA